MADYWSVILPQVKSQSLEDLFFLTAIIWNSKHINQWRCSPLNAAVVYISRPNLTSNQPQGTDTLLLHLLFLFQHSGRRDSGRGGTGIGIRCDGGCQGLCSIRCRGNKAFRLESVWIFLGWVMIRWNGRSQVWAVTCRETFFFFFDVDDMRRRTLKQKRLATWETADCQQVICSMRDD